MDRLYRDAQSIYQKCYGKAHNQSNARLGSFAMNTKRAQLHTEKTDSPETLRCEIRGGNWAKEKR